MRTSGSLPVVTTEQWIEAPLKQFVKEAQVLLALVMNVDGQVLGQYGFTRAVDVMAACALAAAIHASSGELGRHLEGQPFRMVHHGGEERQLFLASTAPSSNGRAPLLVLAVFDGATSLGLVQLYFGELQDRLLSMPLPSSEPSAPVLAKDFESDLDRNLALLFRR